MKKKKSHPVQILRLLNIIPPEKIKDISEQMVFQTSEGHHTFLYEIDDDIYKLLDKDYNI